MASSEPDSVEREVDDAEDAGVAGLLRAVAHAPRPDALHLARQVLPAALAETLGAETREAQTPRVGDVIDGRYRLEQVLGAGGMGIVFAATNLATSRRVALKWMVTRGNYRTASERADAFQRFVREAQAAGRIQHPNVVDVYDAGKDPEAPYLVMEQLDGETLRARMDRGAMRWDEACALLVPAMRGVAEAHQKGVVHRDLKPDNVFLARDRATRELCPKVLDFGVSRLRAQDGSEASLTRTGAVLGTPAYMPLEQLRGEGSVDERTDVYALGVVLYEMLAGRRPYVARNAADFAALIASESPTPLATLCPAVRGARANVVMKALARDPEDRHANVEAFISALERARLPMPPQLRAALLLAAVVLLVGGAWSLRALRSGSASAVAEPRAQAFERAASTTSEPLGGFEAPPAPLPLPSVPSHDETQAQLSPQAPSRALARSTDHARATRTALVSTAPAAAAGRSDASPTTLSADDFRERENTGAAAVRTPLEPELSGPRLDLGREQF